MPTSDPYYKRIVERKERNRQESTPMEFSVKLCRGCNRVFESPLAAKHPGYFIEDFPTYGLEHKTCKHC